MLRFLNSIIGVYLEHACLTDRQSDLKSNRSEDYVANIQIMSRHDKTPVKSTLLSRDMSFMSRRSDIML